MLFRETFILFLAVRAVTASARYRRDNTTSVWNTTVCNEDQLEIAKEWTNMSSSERTAYITAEKCLWELPSTSGLTGATTRFEDLVALHQNMTPIIHAVVSKLYYPLLGDLLKTRIYRVNSCHTIVSTWIYTSTCCEQNAITPDLWRKSQQLLPHHF